MASRRPFLFIHKEKSMAYQGYILFMFGLSLVISLAVIIAVYYLKRNRRDVEAPKYRMLDDDEHH